VVDSRGGQGVATFLVDERPQAGAAIALTEAAARHAQVRRLHEGDAVRVVDGAGTIGTGQLLARAKTSVSVRVESVQSVSRPLAVSLFVPVADRDRMLWLAEKATELAVTRWQPVVFARSRSVSPRGEGEAFARKVRARMISALEQSGGAWLPEMAPECSLMEASITMGDAARYVLDAGGAPLDAFAPFRATALMVGPEGGIEAAELDQLRASGWLPASVGGTTLRFETAGIAALAIVRASQGR
jgi:16S rRNA (uracil1498-N3)-methyltransferase